MNKKPKVCVVGSINMDMATTAIKMPDQGETILGGTFQTYPGGKGANQAVAAARLDSDVSLIGAIGDDPFGYSLLDHFNNENINCDGIQILPDVSTGIATIIVTDNDNRIIVSSGANLRVTPEMIEAAKQTILESDIILLQFEIPMATIKAVVQLAHSHDIPVIINPAPYQTFPEEVAKKASFITPNELENETMKKEGFYTAVKEQLIITMGKHGARYFSNGESLSISPYPVKVIDTTGAGDTFNGALATELARGKAIDDAIHFANAAAALSIGKFGAQAGMPMKQDVDQFLVENKN